jgi:hypothetical protein
MGMGPYTKEIIDGIGVEDIILLSFLCLIYDGN